MPDNKIEIAKVLRKLADARRAADDESGQMRQAGWILWDEAGEELAKVPAVDLDAAADKLDGKGS